MVRSFNADKPYDEFLREQIAGDEMVDWRSSEEHALEIRNHLIPTGFLRMAIDDTDQEVLNIPPPIVLRRCSIPWRSSVRRCSA